MSTTAEKKIERLRPRVPCPECGNDSARMHFPFCSPRCKDIDLNRWLSGSYVIAGRPDDDEDGSEQP